VDSLIPVAIVAALILLNGLFVAAEFAIVGAPRAAVDRLAQGGHRVAARVSRMLREPLLQDRFIATAQLGITFASLGLGMYGEHQLATWIAWQLDPVTPDWVAAHVISSVLAIGILTYFHIVIGEMVPKSLALRQPEQVALLIARPMLFIKALLYPLVIGLNGIGNLVLRLLGINRQLVSAERYYTPEELQHVVEESRQGGALRKESAAMLHELLRFGDLQAGEVMVPRVGVVGIALGTGVDGIKRIVTGARHSRYPVYEEDLDHIVGMVHIKDLLRILIEERAIGRSDARPVPIVPDTAPLDGVLATMRAQRTQLAVVIDEHGGTAGIATLEDLMEEIVGEIGGGSGAPAVFRDASGRLRVPGTTRLDEVGERFSMELAHEEVDSVSGLVLMLLGRPPAVGDAVEYRGLRFEVTAVAGRGVKECAVTAGDS
jgi:CBS domain containing-hemolysin-like protein